MNAPTRDALVIAIETAVRKAFSSLFAHHPTDHFYDCSLITTGEALPLNIAA